MHRIASPRYFLRCGFLPVGLDISLLRRHALGLNSSLPRGASRVLRFGLGRGRRLRSGKCRKTLAVHRVNFCHSTPAEVEPTTPVSSRPLLKDTKRPCRAIQINPASCLYFSFTGGLLPGSLHP